MRDEQGYIVDGECPTCGVFSGVGDPDPCLGGFLPDVAHACCGHGRLWQAYVVICEGCEPSDGCLDLLAQGRPYVVLRENDALSYFAERGVGPERLDKTIKVC